MFLPVQGNWKAYVNFICISAILCLICSKLIIVNKSVASRGNSYNNNCQKHVHCYNNYLIETFEKINLAKTGFHHLRSLGVPPVNLKMERKPLQ